jgi:CrcB protein
MSSTIAGIAAVALGGSLGALARFGVYAVLHGPAGKPSPWSTMAINLFGCLALGLLLGWAARRGPMDDLVRTFLTVGVLGAFTTFSTYAGDALRLVQEGRPAAALAYAVLSAVLGLALCAGGYALLAR